MPLYIKDPAVDALAAKVQRETGVSSKTEAVRRALRNELSRARQAKPLVERLTKAKTIAAEIGPVRVDFNTRTFTKRCWSP